jgi:hypothetical protein
MFFFAGRKKSLAMSRIAVEPRFFFKPGRIAFGKGNLATTDLTLW